MNLFSVRGDFIAYGKLEAKRYLRVRIALVTHLETVKVIAHYKIVLVTKVNLKAGLAILVKNLKLIANTCRYQYLVTVVGAGGIIARNEDGVPVNTGDMINHKPNPG